MAKKVMLVLLLIAPGILVLVVCGYFAIVDWGQLQVDYGHYRDAVARGGDMRNLFIAHSGQNIHRINLFADGVWALLGAILAGIGLHGLCTIPTRRD